MPTIASPLTTGWEPDLDPGDTVLRRFVLHQGEHLAAAASVSGGRVERHDHLLLADTGRPSAFHNGAVLLQPPATADDWDDVLASVDRFFEPGTGTVYLFCPWPTPDLGDHGWKLEGHPPFMVRAAGGRVPPSATAVALREVRDPGELDDWAWVVAQSFPLTELLPVRPGTLLGPGVLRDPRWRLWVAYDGATPVSIGTLFVSHGLAQLALGATLPGARHRGLWYATVRERLLAADGLLVGGLFSDDSRPGAEALGFLPVSRFTLWHRARPTR